MRFSTWIGCRPVLGLLVRKRYLPEPRPVEHFYVIEHQLGHVYLRDPYHLKPNAGDPRSDWGKAHQAWRFRTSELAERALTEQDWVGVVHRIAVSPENRKS